MLGISAEKEMVFFSPPIGLWKQTLKKILFKKQLFCFEDWNYAKSHIQESDTVWNKLKLALHDTITVNSYRKSKKTSHTGCFIMQKSL